MAMWDFVAHGLELIVASGLGYLLWLYMHGGESRGFFSPNSEMLVQSQHGGFTLLGGCRRQAKTLQRAIGFMPPAMQRAVSRICVVPFGDGHLGWEAAAHFHAHEEDDGEQVICFRRGYVIDEVIWHEMTHAYEMLLPIEASQEWVVIAEAGTGNPYREETEFIKLDIDVGVYEGLFGEKQGRKIYQELFGVPRQAALAVVGRSGVCCEMRTDMQAGSWRILSPRNAILSYYGATNYQEDMAVWVQHLYSWLYSARWKRIVNPLWRMRWCGVARAKVGWLFRWGFLSESDYQKLKLLMNS